MIQTPVETGTSRGIHRNIIRSVQQKIPDQIALFGLAELFKIFGDGTRLSILWALSESEMCVYDLCVLLKMKQPAVSHQLRNLKQARIVKTRRDGKVIYYSLVDDHVRKILDYGLEHAQDS